MMKKSVFVLVLFGAMSAMAATDKVVQMNLVDATGAAKPIGTITATESKYGVVLTPNLEGLPAGVHGFHVHVNPDCSPKEQDGKMVPALAAGGHFDPAKTNKHEGPWGEGHLGDLPPLYVTADGKATTAVLAPRLKLADLDGHSLMVHAGGDNNSDNPMPLGGGGARMACGVVK